MILSFTKGIKSEDNWTGVQLSSDLIPFVKDKTFLKPNDFPKVNKFHFRRTLVNTAMKFTRRRLSNMEETKCGPTRVALSRK